MARAKLTSTDYKKMCTRKRRSAENKYKLHLKRLSEYSCNIILPATFLYECENGKLYYKRLYRDRYSYGYMINYKRIANRRVRQYKGKISGGCGYRRIFDYWWTII